MSKHPRSDPQHAPYGSVLARLIYAYRITDGAYVSVSEVTSGLHPELLCPAPSCRVPLIARKGPTGRAAHFAHYKASDACVGGRETSAHLLAKDILSEALSLTIPAVVAEFEGETIEVSPKGIMVFDRAVLEDRLGDLVPDVVLHIGEKRLLVEVRVTHPCDAAKIAKLRSRDFATIEIDIRKAQHGDRATIAAAILSSAPRVWLHNARRDEALTRLKRQAAARVQAKMEALRSRARALVAIDRQIVSRPDGQAACERLATLGFHDLMPAGVRGRVFTVPDREWQALIADKVLLVDYCDQWDGTFGVAALVDWSRKMGLIRSGLAPKWDPGLLDAVLEVDPGFRTATSTLTTYFRALERTGRLETAGKNRWRRSSAFSDEVATRHAAVRRAGERWVSVERLVGRIVAFVPDGAQFDFPAWAGSPLPGVNATLSAIVQDDTWAELHQGLTRIEHTLAWGANTVPERVFGLPIEAALMEAVAAFRRRREEAEADRLQALQAAAVARIAAVRQGFALVMPANEVESKLDARFRGRPGTVREEALAGAEGRDYALSWVRAEAQRQETVRRNDAIAEDFRHVLLETATKRLGDVRGRLWCSTANPALGGARPQDHCTNQRALNHCLSALQDQAKGGRR